ncbi:fused chemotaxis regulator; protein-glutamat [Legionella wadsworthii]|uniref:protein-glutamate methylesterase n=1 Tax=Legionella wadsworthii TaxID=28088 RepID=A0A378LP16_9GAMM|nr:chemotaxis protein CheB [Legionella wadsworthii]STY28427.1 fused chemotaxis regulator; protein-glutamat [Legionella wadsworthii]
MKEFRIIVIGCSSGGLNALKKILSLLPIDFPAAILIVQHLSPTEKSFLPKLLQQTCKFPVILAADEQLLASNTVFVAPPDFHMVVSKNKIHLDKGVKVNFSRPAIDRLFNSAAMNHGSNVIGIVLSGQLDDGSAGLRAIKRCNGISIVQSLTEAQYPEMPKNAAHAVLPDYCLTMEQISSILIVLAAQKIEIMNDTRLSTRLQIETGINDSSNHIAAEKSNHLVPLFAPICPDCNSFLNNHDQEFEGCRCLQESMLNFTLLGAELAIKTEEAFWAALRALEEKERFAKNTASKANDANSVNKEYFLEKANTLGEQIKTIRKILDEIPNYL